MRRPLFTIAGLTALALLAACGASPEEPAAPGKEAAAPAAPPERTASLTTRSPDDPALVIFLGDSLTAGLGVSGMEAFPTVIYQTFRDRGDPVRIVNAGVSGDTTAGGLGRIDWVLKQEPDLIVLGLGANDGLRGLPVEMTERNLREIIERAREAGAAVILTGMMLPRNYGPEYTAGFEGIYPGLAEEMSLPLVPFLLEGVAGVPSLNQEDGIHPNAEGHRRIASLLLPYIEKSLGL